MKPVMSYNEIVLFDAFLSQSKNYLEFGCGGSTFRASNTVKNKVFSVDSSIDWIENVKEFCQRERTKINPEIIYVDIGPIGAWGTPKDKSSKHKWPLYYQFIWEKKEINEVDLVFIDGRFRVACFLAALIHSNPNLIIGIHDFNNREYYHIVRTIAREIASTGTLSFFLPDPSVNKEILRNLLDQHAFDPR